MLPSLPHCFSAVALAPTCTIEPPSRQDEKSLVRIVTSALQFFVCVDVE